MKTSLEKLPEEKQEDLRRFVKLALKVLGDKVEMLILFGSFARGDWVEEFLPDSPLVQYQSDYDIMIVVRDGVDRDNHRLDHLEKLFERPFAPSLQLQFINIGFFNRMLEHGYFFYVDIAKEGWTLYDSGRCALVEPRILTPAEALEKSIEMMIHHLKAVIGFQEKEEVKPEIKTEDKKESEETEESS